MLDTITGIAYLLLILSVLVIVHEWGHFIFAKMFKMRVEEFSLFFGPVLVRLGKRGDTEYNIRSIPLGGFVRIAGMEPDDISGGRPILDAMRDPRFTDPKALEETIKRLEDDTMVGISAENISQEVRDLLHSSVGPDGMMIADRREELEIKQASPKITEDEKKLIQMALMADSKAHDPGLYSQKPIYQRSLAIFGGPLLSLLFGYLVFCLMGMTVGLPSDKQTNKVQVMTPMEDTNEPSPAAKAGMKTGDLIIAINGTTITEGYQMVDLIHGNPGVPLRFTVLRNDKPVSLTITPIPKKLPVFKMGKPIVKDGKQIEAVQGIIGVVPTTILERAGPVESIKDGTVRTLYFFTQLSKTLFSKKVSQSVGGPIAMGQTAIAVQRLGLPYLIFLMGAFSLSLGVMNLLPIPILDGGHLLLLAIEKVRRRKLTPREVHRAQMVGLAMLAAMVVLVMYNDIVRTITGKAMQ